MLVGLLTINIILNLIILLILCWIAMDTDEILTIKKEIKILRRLINGRK